MLFVSFSCFADECRVMLWTDSDEHRDYSHSYDRSYDRGYDYDYEDEYDVFTIDPAQYPPNELLSEPAPAC
jgi:hypothetical protein